jgi:hypothetical protein
MQEITRDPIGIGQERMCFVHPEDPRLAIKIAKAGDSALSSAEIRFYRGLKNHGATTGKHIPRFHGSCETNRGDGIVVDLVRSYDGEVARPLNWYLAHGFPIEEFEESLEELRLFFLQHLLLFDEKLSSSDLLVQRTAAARVRLVVINRFGQAAKAGWLAFLQRRRIQRRWERFIEALYFSREVLLQREAMAQQTHPD